MKYLRLMFIGAVFMFLPGCVSIIARTVSYSQPRIYPGFQFATGFLLDVLDKSDDGFVSVLGKINTCLVYAIDIPFELAFDTIMLPYDIIAESLKKEEESQEY